MIEQTAEITKEELAKRLDGNEYTKEISASLAAQAKKAGLVVIFGASDDLVEFRGAIHDEAGCYEGGAFWIVDGALWDGPGCDHHGGDGCEYARAAEADVKKRGAKIEAIWGAEGYSWIYKTDIPHAIFDVVEGVDNYCRGIVFGLPDTLGNI